jgi:hypothetical protein
MTSSSRSDSQCSSTRRQPDGTWQLAPAEIASLLDRQEGVLHACEAETSMILALERAEVDEDEPSQCRGEYVPAQSPFFHLNS